MKKALVLFVLAMVVLGSCSNGANERKIVGTWADTEGYTWVFSADGKLTYDGNEYKYSVFDGERSTELTIFEVKYNAYIAVGITDQIYNLEYSKDGKTLRLTDGEDLHGWSVAGPGMSENQLTKKRSTGGGSSGGNAAAKSGFEVSPLDGGKSAEITKYVGNKKTVKIPPRIQGMTVTKIGDRAFEYCTRLTSITLPSSVTFIGDYAFAGCGRLASITIPKGVTSIGDWAFSVCENLTSITIPTSVTTIGKSAFSGCTSLTSITIPASVTSIAVQPFSNCHSLTAITVHANNPNYASEGGILYNKDKTILMAYPSASGNVTIPIGVTSIGNGAFVGCTGLTGITIPAGVTSIGNGPFFGCTGLTAITVDANNPNYASEGGILYNKDKTVLMAYPSASGNVIIPIGVTSISVGAFYDCDSLTGIAIPASVTSIGNGAFVGCTGLTGITIPASVTSIGNLVFAKWTASQTINVRSKASQSAADRAWGADWRKGCNAKIVYQGGS